MTSSREAISWATLRGTPDAPKVILRGLDADGNPVTAPVSEAQAKRDWYKGYEGMKYVHSHVNYSRFNGLKYRIELVFDESRTAAGLMQYLKQLGIEPVVVNDAARCLLERQGRTYERATSKQMKRRPVRPNRCGLHR